MIRSAINARSTSFMGSASIITRNLSMMWKRSPWTRSNELRRNIFATSRMFWQQSDRPPPPRLRRADRRALQLRNKSRYGWRNPNQRAKRGTFAALHRVCDDARAERGAVSRADSEPKNRRGRSESRARENVYRSTGDDSGKNAG